MEEFNNSPAIRFSEFRDTWSYHTLGQLSKEVMYGMNSSAIDFDGVNKYLRITDIDEESRRFIPKPLTSPDGNIEDKYKLKEGDIVFARTGASVGKSYLYKKEDGNVLFAGFLIKFSLCGAHPAFIYYLTLRDQYMRWLKLMSMRSGQPGINAEEYKSLKLLIPNLSEQQKIAAFLTAVDDKIQQLRKKKALLDQYKKGVMQQIFNQEIRFKNNEGNEFPEWVERKLGEITEVTKLAGYEFTKHVLYKDSGKTIALRGLNIKFNTLDLKDVKYIDDSDFSKLKRSKLYINDIMYTYVGTIGEVALIQENDRFYLAPNVARIRVLTEEVSPSYLLQYFNLDTFKDKEVKNYIATSSQPALSMENIRKFRIKLPCPLEQTKIVNFLSSIDNKINHVNRQLEQTNQYKKGLIQKMFV
ncbi:type I restriction enzyme S subunit [Pedobacter sp. CAN_A7]|uniref:restriction endonuclease subunit S n=1 Tax=Pedobacter sp. CAN_A7 TaxID=2787722 RepID=UPI0018CA6B8A